MYAINFDSVKAFLVDLLVTLSFLFVVIKLLVSEWRDLKRYLLKGHRKG